MFSNDSVIRTPYHTMPITFGLRSIDRKVYRDQHCIECGKPFISISDKFVSVVDAAIPVELLRSRDRVIEVRCKNHYCKQHYQLWV